jgi:cyclophilin family peptidyl-prolyl cis-trans isomerase/HEAT repeat protein
MRATSGVWRLLALAAVAAVAAGWLGCASSAAPGAPSPNAPPEAAAAPRFASPAEAHSLLLQAEDRRAYDAGLLAAASKSPEESVREHAALAAGRIGDDRARALAEGLLSDPAPGVRSAAAFSCQLLEDGGATPALIPLLSDPDPAVAGGAARAIGVLERGDGEDALIAAIPKVAAPEPRASVLESLWRFADGMSTTAALSYVSDPDVRVRRAALYALSRKPVEKSRPALTAALADSDADIAAGAARALGILAAKDAVGPLAAALDSGKPHLVTSSLNALEAILEKNPGTVVEPDRRARILALSQDANPNLAVPALVLLRQFVGSDRDALSRVWSVAMTGEGRRRNVALLSAVAALRDRAKPALDAAAGSTEAPLRAAAAESLSYLPDATAAPYRAKLAADADPLVRIGVLSSVQTEESARNNRTLIDAAASDPDAGVRAAAVEALALGNDASVVPGLREAVRKAASDAVPDVPIAAIAAAEKLRSIPGSREVVEAAYQLPKTLVQRLARRSLVRSFRADPAAFPAPEYKISRTPADYAAILTEAARPWKANVETARGTFTITMYGDAAPLTVANFLDLARKGYFDGVAIHRVVPDFVIQDGDPTGTGNGGPGYEIRDENNRILYETGTVGMALAGPDTGGSQWFVTHAPQPHLDGIYTVFARVTAGQDVVERIEQWDRITRVTVSAGP